MIGYYVHHQGMGHLQRARSILAHLDGSATLLSSLPAPDPSLPWVRLPLDNLTRPPDHTAHGTLHWVPRHDRGLRRRMAILADWIDAADPDLMVVDVSVEVAVMCRLMGVPTVVMAMPGDRSDRAHRSAYDSAHAILAPWPAEFSAGQWSDRWPDKTFHAGAISRFAGRRPPTAPAQAGPTRIAVVWGKGGIDLPAGSLDAAARATPQCRWRQAGAGADAGCSVWDLLCWAGIVVTHGGQNAVAEVAAAGRPAVVIAQPRPHGEQAATVATLRRAGLAVGLDAFPEPGRWPELLGRAAELGGDGWTRWAPPDAARRAAEFLRATADEVRDAVVEPTA
jgi:UDP-N-acetylglucosamine--N-acetylmuramyl-(pentapeptide) pyrophosphoryl-undecaprenol N-acetylglucosamine transferase